MKSAVCCSNQRSPLCTSQGLHGSANNHAWCKQKAQNLNKTTGRNCDTGGKGTELSAYMYKHEVFMNRNSVHIPKA